MQKQFSLAHLTVIECAPPEMIYIAHRTGYDFVSLRLITMGVLGERPTIVGDKEMIRKTRAALQETGVGVLDLELARIMADREPKTYLPAMELGAELGAKHVISSAWATERLDRSFIIERYAEICDLAKPFGMTVELEFPTFSRLTDLKEAVDIIRAADRPNCGILVDTLYFHLSRVTLQELEALPRQWFHFMHISDTAKEIPDTRDGLVHIARDNRFYIGEGCIDFDAVFTRVPDVPLSIELPNTRRVREFGYEEHARRCIESAKACFQKSSQ
jgi:sugar phosphate isomerase/epimerase